jgi:activator of HSP90 ATPase
MKAAGFGCALILAATAPVASPQNDKSIVIHQEVDLNASPQKVYEALLDGKQFTEFSGRAAEINREIGGASTLFKGHIIARNLELVPNQRIVQGWRVVTWPEGAWSIARFDLNRRDQERTLSSTTSVFPKACMIISLRVGTRTIGRCSKNIFTNSRSTI